MWRKFNQLNSELISTKPATSVPDPGFARFWGVRIISILASLIFVFGLDHLANQYLSQYGAGLVFLAGIYVTLSVSLNLINGITGQFSIGHFAFFQIGAYTAAILSKAYYFHQSLAPFGWVAIMIFPAMLAAAFAGFAVGLPSLRLKGDYLAIVTLGFGEIIRIATENIQHVGKIDVGGSSGFQFHPSYQSISLCWLLAIVCIAMSRNLIKTVHGLGFLSVREDEVAANAMGVNTIRLKVLAFVIGSAFAGAAGALYAHRTGFVIPDEFKMDGSILILTMVIFGGSGSITGSIFAGIVLFYIPELLRDLHNVSFSGVIGTIFAVIFAVSILRRIALNYFGEKKIRFGLYAATLAGAVLLELLIKFFLDFIPKIKAHPPVEGSGLRLVILASTLIIMMLFRPQGVFAHHEFSWAWVRKILGRGKKPNETGVSN